MQLAFITILINCPAVNKPTGPTSAAVLNKLQEQFNPSSLFAPWIQNEKDARQREHHNQRNKRRMNKKVTVKIGHGGTLDPLATGVLVTAIGKGTKSLQNYLECTKEYDAVIVFGTATDTYDRVGKVVKRAPFEHITKEMVEEKLQNFRGKFMQLPPLYSAIKMDGKPLYEYARENKPLPRPIARREVDVINLEMVEWMEPGTHTHKAPEELANEVDMKFLQQQWKNEGMAPAGSANGKGSAKDEQDRRELFERRKRKVSEEQDALVTDAPPNKVRRASREQDSTMSGGLLDQETKNLDFAIPISAPVADEVSVKPRPATLTELKGPPACRIKMTVTSGFYVRSLCHELGPAVGSAACMAELIRTRQGEWELGKNVLDYDELMQGEEVWGPKVETLLEGWEDAQREARRQAALASTRNGRAQESKKEASPSISKDDAPATNVETVPASVIPETKTAPPPEQLVVMEEPLKTENGGEVREVSPKLEEPTK